MLFNTRMRTSEQSKPFGGSFSHHLWLPLLRLLHESCIPVSSLSAHLTSSGPVADTTSMVTTILEDKVTSDATFEPTGAQGIDPRKCLVLSDHLDNFFGLGLPWFQASKASYARSAPPPPPPPGIRNIDLGGWSKLRKVPAWPNEDARRESLLVLSRSPFLHKNIYLLIRQEPTDQSILDVMDL